VIATSTIENIVDGNKIKKSLLASMKNLKIEDPEVKMNVIEIYIHRIIIYVDCIVVTYKIEPSDNTKISDSDKVV